MRIMCVTYNTESTTESKVIEISTAHSNIVKRVGEPVLYAEFTQEDGRDPNDIQPINKLIKEHQYTNIVSISLNPSATKQNMILRVWVTKSIIDTIRPSDNKRRSFAYRNSVKGELVRAFQILFGQNSKGMLWTKIHLYDINILLVNLHLPIYTKKNKDKLPIDPSMGAAYRENILDSLQEELKPQLSDNKTVIIVGGDLNFRMSYELDDDLEQYLLKKNVGVGVGVDVGVGENVGEKVGEPKILSQVGELDYFTCKFKKSCDEETKKCRGQTISSKLGEVNFARDISEIIEQLQEECGDETRIPSKCDRFLTANRDRIELVEYKSHPTCDSDHNAVSVILDIIN